MKYSLLMKPGGCNVSTGVYIHSGWSGGPIFNMEKRFCGCRELTLLWSNSFRASFLVSSYLLSELGIRKESLQVGKLWDVRGLSPLPTPWVPHPILGSKLLHLLPLCLVHW